MESSGLSKQWQKHPQANLDIVHCLSVCFPALVNWAKAILLTLTEEIFELNGWNMQTGRGDDTLPLSFQDCDLDDPVCLGVLSWLVFAAMKPRVETVSGSRHELNTMGVWYLCQLSSVVTTCLFWTNPETWLNVKEMRQCQFLWANLCAQERI